MSTVEAILHTVRSGLESADIQLLASVMAPDVRLQVAVHDEPFVGRDDAIAVLGLVVGDVIHDVRVDEVIDADPGVLLFTAVIAGYHRRAQGLLVVRSDTDEQVSELIVFVRPLAALQAVSDEVGRRLGMPPGPPP